MDRSEVLSSIRACLVSRKGATPLKDLDEDFCSIIGHQIPFERLGFRSLEAFIRSESSLVVSKGREGIGILVRAKISEKSAHVSELVSKQKTDKRKMNSRRFVQQRPFVQQPNQKPYSNQKPRPPNPPRVTPQETLRSSGQGRKGQYYNNPRGNGGGRWRGEIWCSDNRPRWTSYRARQEQIRQEQAREEYARQQLIALIWQLYIQACRRQHW